MERTKPEVLLMVQMSSGCDNACCENKYCCNNPQFSFKKLSTSEIKEIIDNSKESIICKSHSPLLTNSSVLERVSRSALIFKEFVVKGSLTDYDIKYLNLVFDQLECYSHILMSSDHTISKSDLFIDDNLFDTFIIALNNSPSVFALFQGKICALVDRVTAIKDNSLMRLRAILISFLFHPFIKDRVIRLLNALCQFGFVMHSTLINFLSNSPKILKTILVSANECISHYLNSNKKEHPHSSQMHIFASFMSLLFYANQISEYPIPSNLFYNGDFSLRVISSCEFELFKEPKFSYIDLPSILTIEIKEQILGEEFDYLSSINNNKTLDIEVSRDRIINDSLKLFSRLTAKDLKLRLNVNFVNEPAQDDGGVSREYLNLLVNSLINSEPSCFVQLNDGLHWFRTKNYPPKDLYFFFGTLLGVSVVNSIMVPIRFPLVLYKKLQGLKLSLADLSELNPQMASSLSDLRHQAKNGNDISEVGLFMVTTEDEYQTVELVPNGMNIPVTHQNFELYLEKLIDYHINVSVKEQFDSFKDGFFLACQTPVMQMFNYDELDVIVSGTVVFDWEIFQKKALYIGYDSKSKSVELMWSIFNEFNEDKKKKFLRFITGSDRAPIGGLGSVSITIQRSGDIKLLPTAHTCRNILVLPDYNVREKMEWALLTCTEHTEGLFLV